MEKKEVIESKTEADVDDFLQSFLLEQSSTVGDVCGSSSSGDIISKGPVLNKFISRAPVLSSSSSNSGVISRGPVLNNVASPENRVGNRIAWEPQKVSHPKRSVSLHLCRVTVCALYTGESCGGVSQGPGGRDSVHGVEERNNGGEGKRRGGNR